MIKYSFKNIFALGLLLACSTYNVNAHDVVYPQGTYNEASPFVEALDYTVQDLVPESIPYATPVGCFFIGQAGNTSAKAQVCALLAYFFTYVFKNAKAHLGEAEYTRPDITTWQFIKAFIRDGIIGHAKKEEPIKKKKVKIPARGLIAKSCEKISDVLPAVGAYFVAIYLLNTNALSQPTDVTVKHITETVGKLAYKFIPIEQIVQLATLMMSALRAQPAPVVVQS